MTTRFDELTIPRTFDGDAGRWRSHWPKTRPLALKAELQSRDAAERDQWIARFALLDRLRLDRAARP